MYRIKKNYNSFLKIDKKIEYRNLKNVDFSSLLRNFPVNNANNNNNFGGMFSMGQSNNLFLDPLKNPVLINEAKRI